MREKLETLTIMQLKEIAKQEGFKGVSIMKKADIIDLLVEHARKKEEEAAAAKPEKEAEKPAEAKKAASDSNAAPAPKRRVGRPPKNSAVKAPEEASKGEKENNTPPQDKKEAPRRGRPRRVVSKEEGKEVPAAGSAPRPISPAAGNAPRPVSPADQAATQKTPAPVRPAARPADNAEPKGEPASGILEVMPDGFGFIRCHNFLPGEEDVYVAPSQIRRFGLRTGDVITGLKRTKTAAEKFAAFIYLKSVNGESPETVIKRPRFENLTPVFPYQRIHLESYPTTSVAMRIVDLLSPIGKGQRGMIVSQPKAGKTTLLKQIAQAVQKNEPNMYILILLIDERPEEVTDIKESVKGSRVEVIYSTFDELPERHKRVSEMVIERAKRLVEQGKDVMILLDSITRLARAYNLTCAPSGRTLSGGLDPAALYMPKRFFGAARKVREAGSLTILATALVETGSRMDDVVFEEFKGTGNMELVLDRKLSEKRIFPAIDILKSGTRRDDLLLSPREQEAVSIIRRATGSLKPDDAVERILDLFTATKTNAEFAERVIRMRMI